MNVTRRLIPTRSPLRLVLALCFVASCTKERASETAREPKTPALPAANGPRASARIDAEDGQWTMPAKSYSATRYSGLAEITADNVSKLTPAWTFSTSVLRGHEEPPIIVNNTMYVLTPFPNLLYALDLTKPGAPQKWVYDPKPQQEAQGVACCDVVNRGPSFADGKIVFNTLDNHAEAHLYVST